MLIDLANALDAASDVAGKLAKQHALATYFKSLDDDDLRLAVRYASARSFSNTDERTLGTSGRIVSDVVIDLLKLDPADLRTSSIRHGELGSAVAEAWPGNVVGDDAGITLNDLNDAFARIADTTQPARKKPIIRDLFSRCVLPAEAAYIVRFITGDLRTGVREGVLQASLAQAFNVALNDVLRAQLLCGALDEVAVHARNGRLDDVTFTLFHPLQFMLAKPIETPADAPGEWLVEDKLDGIRAQVHKLGNRVCIYTRTLDRIDDSFPDVVAQVRKISADVLLDGEIVPWRSGRALAFSVLQKRLGRKNASAKTIADSPALFVAFDVLYLNGAALLDEPLHTRRHALEALARDHPSVMILPCNKAGSSEDVSRAFDSARAIGNEGLMLKDPQSTYTPGRRGGAWLKLKSHLPTLDCVITAAEYGHGKRRGKLSDYTFAVRDGERLRNIGKAYSGVTDAEIDQLTQELMQISTGDNGRVFQVTPKIVLEIAFDQITRSSRHESGYAMRFPRIKRIRTDKSVADIDTISRVEEIYRSAQNLGLVEAPAELARNAEPTLFDVVMNSAVDSAEDKR